MFPFRDWSAFRSSDDSWFLAKYLSRVTDGSTCAIHFAFNVMRMWFRHFALDSDLFVEVEIEIRTKIAPSNQWKKYK